MTRGYITALSAVALLDAILLWWGLELLFIPPIYKLARMHSPLLYYEGHILILLSVLLAWCRGWAAEKVMWLCKEIHRWASALMVLGALAIDGSMHLLGIPHIEGWWLPLLGSSAFITGMSAWLHGWRKKPKDL